MNFSQVHFSMSGHQAPWDPNFICAINFEATNKLNISYFSDSTLFSIQKCRYYVVVAGWRFAGQSQAAAGTAAGQQDRKLLYWLWPAQPDEWIAPAVSAGWQWPKS